MKTATKKKRFTEAGLDREHEQKQARLRKYVGRLVTGHTKPGGFTYDYKPRMTFRMFCIFMRIDEAMIGTPDYAGIAYWWAHEYKHYLRDCTTKQRKKAHDALLDAGLRLDGVSDEHHRIIVKVTRPAKRSGR